MHNLLGADLHAQQRALPRLALSFYTLRTLTQQAELETPAAVDAMAKMIEGGKAKA